MKRLEEKLRSQSGASILLALLMFLVCVMVGSSVLAAAASNAGKARSNRTEQQRYLTLSSAIRLVAEELERAEYTGKYTVYEWTVPESEEKNPDGTPVTPAEECFCCVQEPGEFSCGDLTAQLPLGKELDRIFSGRFAAKASVGYQGLPDGETEGPAPRTLTVTLPDDLEGYPASGPDAYNLEKTVTVKVELKHATRHILLTAWLGADPEPPEGGKKDTLYAELVAKITADPSASPPETAPGNLELNYIPLGRTAKDSFPEDADERDGTVAGAPLRWELSWIKKGAVS